MAACGCSLPSPVRASGAGKLLLRLLFFSSLASCSPAFPFLLFRSAIFRPAGVAAATAGGGFLCADPVVVCSLRSHRSF